MELPKVVYIAGPFRAKSAWGVECNVREADYLALDVWRSGAAVICPHTNTRFFDGAADGSRVKNPKKSAHQIDRGKANGRAREEFSGRFSGPS